MNQFVLEVRENYSRELLKFLLDENKLANVLQNIDKKKYTVIDINGLGEINTGDDYQVLIKKPNGLEIGG